MSKPVDFPGTASQSAVDPGIQAATLALLKKQEQLAELQAEELLRQKALREEADRIKRAAREGNIETIAKKLAQEKAEQDSCIHRKPAPSHESALAGQRDHHQTVHYVCQYCGKQFTDKTIPADLRIPADRVGGPVL